MTGFLGAAVLVIAGCSSSAGESDAGPCTYDETVDGVTATGTNGEQATIEVTPGTQPATELTVEDVCSGDGEAAAAADTVTVNYVGVSLSTGEVFDSSYSRGAPATFGLNQVIQGWQDGLVGMQEGGTRLLVIPPDQAYGEVSPGPGIAPNDTLIFVVDLIDVV